MYCISNICGVTVSALYFGPCYELSCWLPVQHILISFTFCPLTHCITAIERLSVARNATGSSSMTWFPFSSNLLNINCGTLPFHALNTAWKETHSLKQTLKKI